MFKRPCHGWYIAYYRVSTDRQGASGLGLDAQRAAVSRHIGEHGQLVAEYTEIESVVAAERLRISGRQIPSRKPDFMFPTPRRRATSTSFRTSICAE